MNTRFHKLKLFKDLDAFSPKAASVWLCILILVFLGKSDCVCFIGFIKTSGCTTNMYRQNI